MVPSISGSPWNDGIEITVNSRDEPAEFLVAGRLDEHILGEQRVPGILGDDPDRQAVVRIGAAIAVLHEQVAALQEALQSL